jgi:hypothetical protein
MSHRKVITWCDHLTTVLTMKTMILFCLTFTVLSMVGCASSSEFKNDPTAKKPHWILGDPSRPTHVAHSKARFHTQQFGWGGFDPTQPVPGSQLPIVTNRRREINNQGNGFSYHYSQGQNFTIWPQIDLYGRMTVESSSQSWITEYRNTWPKRPDPVRIEIVPGGPTPSYIQGNPSIGRLIR